MKGGGWTVVMNLIHEELETLEERLDHLDPKERLEELVKLLPYVLPKVYPASYTTDEPITFLCKSSRCQATYKFTFHAHCSISDCTNSIFELRV